MYGISMGEESNLIITGGSVTSDTGEGIRARNNAKIEVGSKTDSLSVSNPIITGKNYGIRLSVITNSEASWDFYNGKVRGKTKLYDIEPTNVRENCIIQKQDETEDGTTYHVAYLEKVPTVSEAITSGTEFKKNTEIEDTYGNIVTVPEGFKVASDSGTDVTKGVVIEDVSHGATAGSQFVWIPVGKVYTTTDEATKESTAKTINLDRYTFAISGTPTAQGENVISSYYRELATSGYGNTTAKDIEGFKTSVTNNGGYYIGRYEAGDSSATAERTSSSGVTGTMISKAGQYAYTCVTPSQAAILSRNMYSSSNFTSDLMNSYAWDTAIVFIQEFSRDSDYSQQYAIQTDKQAKTGEATDGKAKDVRCNIYDMAGNVPEWTTETSSSSYGPNVDRGGFFKFNSYRTGLRYSYKDDIYADTSFRPVLYIE